MNSHRYTTNNIEQPQTASQPYYCRYSNRPSIVPASMRQATIPALYDRAIGTIILRTLTHRLILSGCQAISQTLVYTAGNRHYSTGTIQSVLFNRHYSTGTIQPVLFNGHYSTGIIQPEHCKRDPCYTGTIQPALYKGPLLYRHNSTGTIRGTSAISALINRQYSTGPTQPAL